MVKNLGSQEEFLLKLFREGKSRVGPAVRKEAVRCSPVYLLTFTWNIRKLVSQGCLSACRPFKDLKVTVYQITDKGVNCIQQ